MKKNLQAFLLGFFLFLTGIASAAEIHDLNSTDASNTARFPEGMAPSAVNDAARALEGLLSRGLKDTVDGYVLTSGTSSALLVAATRTLSAYYDGLTQGVEWHTTPDASATVNLDSLGAKSLIWPNGSAVGSGELISGARALIQYQSSSDKFQILTLPSSPGPSTSGGVTGQLPKYSATSAFTASGITSSSVSLIGKRTIWIPASAMTARTTSGAVISSAELSTNKVMLNALAFGGAGISYAQFNVAAPKSWDGGTLTSQFDWTSNNGSGTVQWYAQCLSVGDGDALDAAFGTARGITDTLLSTNQEHLSPETSAITCSGSNSSQDRLVFQIYRDGATDTHTGDSHLLGVRLYMTTSGQNDQ